jgi:hypothetical protein
MAKNPATLDRLRIATPCPIGWDQMTGDNRVRFCDHCHLNVYNIAELSRSEAEKLIASTEGRLCARLFRRGDGTILTKDCPVGLRALRRRVAKRTAAIFAAIVSLASVALGQQGSSKNGKTGCIPQTRITRTKSTSSANEKALSGTVLDPIGAVIPAAKIKLINAEAKETRETTTNEDGRFEINPVASGNYSLMIELPGFKNLEIKNLSVEGDTLINIELILEPSLQWETVGILASEPSLIVTPPGTTIFNEKMIQSLPHQK